MKRLSIVMLALCAVAGCNQAPDHQEELPRSRDYRYPQGSTERWASTRATILSDAASAGKYPAVVTLVACYASEEAACAEFVGVPRLDQAMREPATVCRCGEAILVALPPAEQSARQWWEEQLRRGAREVAVGDEETRLAFHLTFKTANKEQTESLVEELVAYFYFARPQQVLAPWSPARATLEPEQRQRLQRGRRVLGRLLTLDRRVYEEREAKAAVDEFNQAEQSRDADAVRERSENLANIVEATRGHLLGEILAGKDKADQAVADLWQQIRRVESDLAAARSNPDRTAGAKKTRMYESQLDDMYRQMAERVGVLPLPNSTSAANVDRSGCTTRAAVLLYDEHTVIICGASFFCPIVGLPAFGEWLARDGVDEIRLQAFAVPPENRATGAGPD